RLVVDSLLVLGLGQRFGFPESPGLGECLTAQPVVDPRVAVDRMAETEMFFVAPVENREGVFDPTESGQAERGDHAGPYERRPFGPVKEWECHVSRRPRPFEGEDDDRAAGGDLVSPV